MARRSAPSAFLNLVVAHGLQAALASVAVAAAARRGLTTDPEALAALTGAGFLRHAGAPAPAEDTEAVAADPGRLGELYALGLAAEERKRHGIFYTPAWVAAEALRGAPRPGERVFDPACGGGRFLLAAYDTLARHQSPADALSRLRGLDTDPLAVELCRAALYLRAACAPGEPLPVAEAVRTGDLLALHAAGDPPRGLDLVVGNPPYRGGRFSPLAALGAEGRARFRVAEYQVDPYVLFLEAGLAALRPGGRLVMVVPNTFMSNLRTGALRRLLATEACLDDVTELPPEAFGAGVETVIVRATKGGRTPVRVPVRRAEPQDTLPSGTLLVSAEDRAAPWPLLRGLRPVPVRSAQVLGSIAEITRGINPYHHTRHTPEEIRTRVHHADHQAAPDFAPELRGRDLQPFRIDWRGRHWIRYGPWLKEPRDPRFFEGPRLLVRKILGPTLVAAYTDAPFLCDQSIYIAKLQPGQPWPPLALLACLGSRHVAELLRTRHQEHDTLFPQLKVAELRDVPLPAVTPDDQRLTALAAALEAHLAAGAPEDARGPIDAAVEALYLG